MGLFDAVKNSFSGSDTEEIWNVINAPAQLDEILKKSENRPQLIYKHSHRCSVCFVAKGNLEQAAEDIQKNAGMHFLNVVHNREASNYIASELDVHHESPQAILISNREVIRHDSHGSIDADKILEVLDIE